MAMAGWGHPQHFFLNLQGALVEGLGAAVFADAAVELGEIVEAATSGWVAPSTFSWISRARR